MARSPPGWAFDGVRRRALALLTLGVLTVGALLVWLGDSWRIPLVLALVAALGSLYAIHIAVANRHLVAAQGELHRAQAEQRRALEELEAERAKLRGMVDPFSYCDTLTLPKLVVLGTNDPYWNVDSANNYFPYLKGDKYLYYCANTKHDVNPNGVATIRAFYQSMLTGERLPRIEWSSQPGGALKVAWEHPEAKARLWKATSPNRDFRGSQWVSEELTAEGKTATAKVEPPETGWVAYYVEVVHPVPGGQPFGLCTTMTVLPDTYPFPEAPKEFQRGTNADVR